MENKKEVIWDHYKLSEDLPGMEMITAVKEDLKEFTIETLSCDFKETVKTVFELSAVITYRRMKVLDTYNFPEEERSYAGFLSVSDNSAFLEWYRSVRLFDTEKETLSGVVRSYTIFTDSDVMEVISYAPPKVYYGPDLVVEEEKKE